MWYDPNPSVAGGAVLVTTVANISDITAGSFAASDFVFI